MADRKDIYMDKETKVMFNLILQKLDGVDVRLGGMDKRFDAMDARLDTMDEKIDAMNTDMRYVRLRLENEIAENIKRVAEGHMDLSRNLHEAMKPQTEIEMLVIRVNSLETKVRDLQHKVSIIS